MRRIVSSRSGNTREKTPSPAELVGACKTSFGAGALERGRGYFNTGKVLDVFWDEDKHQLSGSVAGSYQDAYEVLVEITRSRGGLELDSDCDCPVGYNCKHGVALVLKFAHDAEDQKPAGSALSQWRRMLSTYRGDAQAGQATDPTYCFLYTLGTRPYRDHTRLNLGVVKARRLKKGGFGKPQSLRDHELTGSYNQRFMNDKDVEIIQLIQASRSPFILTSEMTLKGEAGGLLLQKLLQTGRCYMQGEMDRVLVQSPALVPQLAWRSVSSNKELVCSLPNVAGEWLCTPTTPAFYIDLETLSAGRLETDLSGELLNRLLMMPALPESDARALSRDLLGDTRLQHLPPPLALDVSVVENVIPVPRLTLLCRPDDAAGLHVARLESVYGKHVVPHYQARGDEQIICADANATSASNAEVLIKRGVEHELTFLRTLMSLSFVLTFNDSAESSGVYIKPAADDASLADAWRVFLNESVVELETQGWQIVFDDSFSLRFVEADSWNLDASDVGQKDSGNDGAGSGWFDMSMDIEVAGNKLALLPLLVRWLESQRGDIQQRLAEEEDVWVRAEDQTYVRLPADVLRAMLSTLVELLEDKVLDDDAALQLSNLHAPLLLELEDKLRNANVRLGKWRIDKTLETLAQRLQSFGGIQAVKPPAGLNATLRDYQQQGLNWLQFLREFGFNGVLADDMGLGKTVQVLANLMIEKNAGRLTKPSLVIVPTSLISNWRREAEKFTPKISILVLHGSLRHESFAQLGAYDIVITTYSLLPRDADMLLAQDFYYVVLDESQWIKNAKTKAARTACELQADHRLCVTGTPLENNLGEVWSQFHFLMPGFLGSQDTFNTRFRYPIERKGDLLRSEGLAARLAPFILRRTKRQVASELPDKVEMESTVSFESKQAVLYESVRASMEKRVRDALASQGMAKSHITILDALLKLRQVCCDPRLVKLEQAATVKQSAKLELLMDLLPEMVAEGRKVLLFSQFTSMLSLIETELAQKAIQYTKLTGATRKRDDAIAAFQEGNASVFLISLKAGGVGLNLTAADTVILYDPWWNPATERQAIDRAHRIGQDKTVFVYRLIVENSIEERIVALQASKQQLADKLVSTDGDAVKTMNSDDILDLFRE